MKLRKWLKYINPIGLTVIVWDIDADEEEGPIYEGSAFDLPWWIGEAKITKEAGDFDEPIDFRKSLGDSCNNEPGVVICVKFKEA
jgi:hypothetical protein